MRRRFPVLLAIALIAVIVATLPAPVVPAETSFTKRTGQISATPTPAASATPGSESNAARCLNPAEEQFLELINDFRQSHGLEPLQVSASLNQAAYRHSLDMAQRDYFSHKTMRPLPEGLTSGKFTARIDAAGYPTDTYLGENIAAGHRSAQEVFTAWKNSPHHRANMLNPNFEAIGIGRATAAESRYGTYWTTNFGGIVTEAPQCPSS